MRPSDEPPVGKGPGSSATSAPPGAADRAGKAEVGRRQYQHVLEMSPDADGWREE